MILPQRKPGGKRGLKEGLEGSDPPPKVSLEGLVGSDPPPKVSLEELEGEDPPPKGYFGIRSSPPQG